MKRYKNLFWLVLVIGAILTYSLWPESPIKKADCWKKQFGKTLVGIQCIDLRNKLHSIYVDWGPDGDLDQVEKWKIYNGVKTKEIIVFTTSEDETDKLNSEATELNRHGNLVPKDPNKRYLWTESPEGQTWQDKFEGVIEDYQGGGK